MFLNDDDMVECPYNNTHRMLRKRLQPHLLKCRLHYSHVELRKCPFNILHLIPEPEYAHHATNCPDRKLITQYKYDAPEQKEDEIPKHAPIECDENWDDTVVTDYNPRLHLEKASVLLKPEGASRSERKLFIKKERKRLGDDDSSDDDSKSGASSYAIKRQKYEYYRDLEARAENYDVHYGEEMRSRHYRRSPSYSSSLSTRRSRSPIDRADSSLLSTRRSRSSINRANSRNPSHSPIGWPRSREYSPPGRQSFPSYPRQLSLPSHSYSVTEQDHYYRRRARTPNNDQYNSGRDDYYIEYTSYQPHYDRQYEINYTMPHAPPPPIISYPRPQVYSSDYPYPPFSKR